VRNNFSVPQAAMTFATVSAALFDRYTHRHRHTANTHIHTHTQTRKQPHRSLWVHDSPVPRYRILSGTIKLVCRWSVPEVSRLVLSVCGCVWLCSKIAALDSKLAFQHWKPVTAVNVGYGYVSFPFPDWQGSLLHVEARRSRLIQRHHLPAACLQPSVSIQSCERLKAHKSVLRVVLVCGSSQRWPADATWMPLLASTNPLPEYPSYHSAAGRRHSHATPSHRGIGDLDTQLCKGHLQVEIQGYIEASTCLRGD
jgi:hypothetical protein